MLEKLKISPRGLVRWTVLLLAIGVQFYDGFLGIFALVLAVLVWAALDELPTKSPEIRRKWLAIGALLVIVVVIFLLNDGYSWMITVYGWLLFSFMGLMEFISNLVN